MHVSAVHVYLTYPFVLSWSLLEAIARAVTSSDQIRPPVAEFIQHQQNGVLVDFFDVAALVDAVQEGLSAGDAGQALRLAARQTILEHYDLQSICLPRQIELLEKFGADDHSGRSGVD